MGSLNEFQAKGGKVLLLDTGSTDNTPEIARKLGVEVHEVGDKFLKVIDKDTAEKINNQFIVKGELPIVKAGDKLFDYSSARNYIAEFSPTDMIATPDCDEIYTKLDLDKIQEAIDSGAEQLEYNFVFAHDRYGNELVKFMHSKFYNRKKLKWVGIIHEVLQGQAKRKFLDESIIKLEHWQNPEQNRGHYLKGLALDCYENPKNERNSHYLGRELLWTGHPKSAIKELERCISIHWWPSEISQSMVYIARAYGMLNKPEKQLEWLNKAIEKDGTRREPFIELARFYQHNNKPQLAASYANASLAIEWSNFYGNDMKHYTTEPHEILYWAYGWLGLIEKAKQELDICLKYQPLNSQYLRDYRFYNDLPSISIIIPQLGRELGLKRCLDSIKKLNYPQELIEVVIEDGPESVPIKVKNGLSKAKNELIVYGANDIEFTPDSLILAVLASKDYGLVAFNTGVPNECEHFLIDRELIEWIGGEIFDTDFHHVGVDNILWEKANKLGDAVRCEEAIVHHYHFSRGGVMDEIYEKGWSKVDSDRELLKKKLAIL